MKILRAIICISVAIGLATGAVIWPVSQSERNVAEARKHNAKGIKFFQKKAFVEALKEFDHACRLNPSGATSFQCRAYAHTELGNYELALKDFSRQIELCPGFIAYSDRADLRTRTGDLKGAVADLTRAVKLFPNDASLFYERGLVFQKLGNHKAAYEDFDQSIGLDNHKALSYMGRGISEFYLSEKRNAYADCARATQLDGRSVWYQCLHSEIPIPRT